MLPSQSEFSYNTYRRKFASFIGITEFDRTKFLPKEVYYTDANFSTFLAEEMKNCNYVVSVFWLNLIVFIATSNLILLASFML
jgi:hypothetical protein